MCRKEYHHRPYKLQRVSLHNINEKLHAFYFLFIFTKKSCFDANFENYSMILIQVKHGRTTTKTGTTNLSNCGRNFDVIKS